MTNTYSSYLISEIHTEYDCIVMRISFPCTKKKKPLHLSSRVTVSCSSRSLRTAVSCLLSAYTEDFRDPPHYSTLHHLLRHFPDRESQKQCNVLLEQFQYDEENNPSNLDDNNNYRHQNSSSHYLAHQRGLDYITPCNILEMSSTMIAEQLTIVDAVCCRDNELIGGERSCLSRTC